MNREKREKERKREKVNHANPPYWLKAKINSNSNTGHFNVLINMACFLLRMFHKHSHISTRPTQLASIPFTIRSKIAYSNQWLRNASSHSPELQKKGGEIQLICGPMFAGKTTELLRRARRYIEAQYKCLWIKVNFYIIF